MICLAITNARSPVDARLLLSNAVVNYKENSRGLKSKPKPKSNSVCLKRVSSTLQLSLLSEVKTRREIEIRCQMAKNEGPVAGAAAAEIILTSGASGRVNALLSMRALKSLLMLINAFILLLLFPFRGRRRTSGSSISTAAAGVVVAVGSSEKGSSKELEKQDGISRGKGLPVVRVPATIVPWKSSASAVASDQEVAARRALAIRRVTNDDKESVRAFSMFASRGDTMFTQSWAPVSIKARGLVVLLHGLNEHSGRYNEFAKQLNAHGYKVYAMDWVADSQPGKRHAVMLIFLSVAGHGGSDGLHAYVHSLDDAVTDVKLFIMKVLAENPGLPCFCFGHSTGGAIVLKAVLDPKIETSIAGIVLTSPAVGVQPAHPIFAILAPVFSLLLPRYQLSAANKKGTAVSRDPQALLAKYSDPLVYTGSIRIRTGYEILRITSYLQRNLRRVKVPFLVLHGTADTVTDPVASQKLYEEASSNDKSIKLLEGLLHDLLFEPERKEIVEGIIEWLNSRMQG